MIVLHTHKPDYEPSAREVKVLGHVDDATYLGTNDHKAAFALVLSGHAELTVRDPYWAYLYASEVIKGRWPEAEAAIVTDPEWAYYYARFVIRGRWPEAEAAIVTDPEWAYWYACEVIKDRWPPGEAVIVTSPAFAYRYACDVIEARWPEAEAVIAADPEYKGWYEQRFGVEL